jgi:hypothetical protein
MKKFITLILFAAATISQASAQSKNYKGFDYNNQDRYQVNQQNDNWKNNDHHQSKDYGYNNHKGRNDDYKRQADYDRMNREYDSRIDGYRNDRRLNKYERDRRIQQAEQERQQKAKAFGTGMVAGGIAAILLGVLIAGGK